MKRYWYFITKKGRLSKKNNYFDPLIGYSEDEKHFIISNDKAIEINRDQYKSRKFCSERMVSGINKIIVSGKQTNWNIYLKYKN